MNQGILNKAMALAIAALLVLATPAYGQKPEDPFKGRLFAPNVILESRDELNLSKEQFQAIRTAVVETQGSIAEHEWDMREAYMGLMEELDKSPIDETTVLAHADTAMRAENQVKKQQMRLLIQLKNLLTDEQVRILEAKHGQ